MSALKSLTSSFLQGTGKTTTARKIGQVYFDMGFLSSTEVVECSASDLVGEYVGQTSPKTRKLFEKALGRVLFIDEAYRLSEGHFAKEAIDELVGTLTQEKFRSKMVVILAGYDREMNELMAVNTGLSSRFPDEIIFRNLKPAQCLEVLKKELGKKKIRLSQLDDPTHPGYKAMLARLDALSCLPSWGNARDIITLSKRMVTVVYDLKPDDRNEDLALSVEDAVACMTNMLADRSERSGNLPSNPRSRQLDGMQQMPNAPTLSPHAIRLSQTVDTSVHDLSQDDISPPQVLSDGRDSNVSDETWHQLQLDKEVSEAAAKALEADTRRLEQELRDMAELEKLQQEQMAKAKLAEARARDVLERDKLREAHEAMRLQQVRDRLERERIAALLEVEREKQRQEAKVQQKLRAMGVCVAGFQWIKQASGYRCAGGFHFVDNVALGI
jgi:SpoVK/Ycf46/Vps4 family AAA+-type ATPase